MALSLEDREIKETVDFIGCTTSAMKSLLSWILSFKESLLYRAACVVLCVSKYEGPFL